MKHLQSFSLFEAQETSDLTQKQKTFLTKYTQGTWSVNPETGLVDVEGDFDCSYKRLKSLSGISFGHVSGAFYCYNNQLTTLAGAPQTVDGHFYCQNNQLTTLVGAPQTVGRNFECFNNQLTTLAGAPQTVGGHFYCGGGNRLTTLVGAPQTVGWDFECSGNRLTTLAGAPQTVGGSFWCHQNRLTTLAGAPQTVDGYFTCDSFTLQRGEWNPLGWTEILATGDSKARRLIVTLPQIKPDFWLELYRTKRKNFYDLWLTYRQDPRIRKTELFQQVESSLPGQAKSSLEDLEDLRDLGI